MAAKKKKKASKKKGKPAELIISKARVKNAGCLPLLWPSVSGKR